MSLGWTFSPDPAVESAMRDIYTRYPPLYPTSLERQRRFLTKLGNPQQKRPFTFHIAGTNGKGSTLAFLHAIFDAAALSVHKYTSPHLVSFDERIIINGQHIAPGLLLELIGECAAAAGGEEISFFEFFTGLAFLAFSRHPADVLLLETGLGGLYDATNAVDGNNLVSLLTTISYDHTNVLGETLTEIATHKAGIIKAFAPCVIAPQEPAAAEVFIKTAAAQNAPVFLYDRDWRVTFPDEGFEYRSATHHFRLPAPALQGQHQMYNAGLALAALEKSPPENNFCARLLDQKILEQALQNVSWPGRLQKITAARLPQGWELWLDGAHNDSGAAALAEHFSRHKGGLPLHLITAMKRTKDVSGFYKPLLPHAASIQAVEPFAADAPMLAAEELCACIRALGYAPVKTAATLESALDALSFQFKTPQRILVTGSLYLAGHALKRQL